MSFSHAPVSPSLSPSPGLFIPDELAPRAAALGRTTHLGIGAHQDDLEFGALHGILACFNQADRWFGGVTCTDGAGSARTGPYADVSDEKLRAIRLREQHLGATLGQFSFVSQPGFSSAAIKTRAGRAPLVAHLREILAETRPEVVYTHNPLDRHSTHLAVFLASLEALRSLPATERPRAVYGYEAWRALDWAEPGDRVALDVSDRPNLAAGLAGVFDSQIAGGKRYDLAVTGRRLANATFGDSHSADAASQVSYAVDLMPLLEDPTLDPAAFALGFVERLRGSVAGLFAAVEG